MRANNVLRLLAYNLFEYTFLSECIASMLGVDLGTHHHYVVSLHAYDPDIPRLTEVIDGLGNGAAPSAMPTMESSDAVFRTAASTFGCASSLIQGLRKRRRDVAIAALDEASGLPQYWGDIFRAVAEACMLTAGKHELVAELYRRLGPLPAWAEGFITPSPTLGSQAQ